MKLIPTFNASLIRWNKKNGTVLESQLKNPYITFKRGFRLKSDRTGVILTFRCCDIAEDVWRFSSTNNEHLITVIKGK